MKISTIEEGKSYACRYKFDRVFTEDGCVKTVSDTGFGVIRTRDHNQQLVEIVDPETGDTAIVPWENCWDIDEVNWGVDNLGS